MLHGVKCGGVDNSRKGFGLIIPQYIETENLYPPRFIGGVFSESPRFLKRECILDRATFVRACGCKGLALGYLGVGGRGSRVTAAQDWGSLV